MQTKFKQLAGVLVLAMGGLAAGNASAVTLVDTTGLPGIGYQEFSAGNWIVKNTDNWQWHICSKVPQFKTGSDDKNHRWQRRQISNSHPEGCHFRTYKETGGQILIGSGSSTDRSSRPLFLKKLIGANRNDQELFCKELPVTPNIFIPPAT